MSRPTIDPEERFWANVQIGRPDECWSWTGYVNPESGRGQINLHGRTTTAARAMWFFVHGVLPLGHVVRHRCVNDWCVNPWHLLSGTAEENTADAIAAGHRPGIGLRQGVQQRAAFDRCWSVHNERLAVARMDAGLPPLFLPCPDEPGHERAIAQLKQDVAAHLPFRRALERTLAEPMPEAS